ncbi:Protein STRUBBELIG-RECEPTOR FAMILY 8, partial [Mucuna pruriens]
MIYFLASFESPSVPFFNGLALYNQSRSETQLLRYYLHSPLLLLLLLPHDTLHAPLRTQTTLLTAMSRARFPLSLFLALIFLALPLSLANTDSSDVQALEVMYNALNGPTQLTGWRIGGGDPCGESWKGVTCEGSAVVSIELSGLGLDGTLGYLLSDLMSLRKLDLSDNKIHDTIPYQLPPNLTSLNFARNNLSGNLPYSISAMVSLNYLNLSNNALSMTVGDIFASLSDLGTLDLSFNNFSGDLPPSFGSLSNLSSLFLQKNQLTGTLRVLVGLPLDTLNVANNNFSGWIPQELSSIHNFIYAGNSFENGPAPLPPAFTSPPPSGSHNSHHHSVSGSHNKTQTSENENSDGHKGLRAGAIVGIVLGSVLVAAIVLLALVFCIQKQKGKKKGSRNFSGSLPRGVINVTPQMQEQRVKSAAVVTDLKPRPAENVTVERIPVKSGSAKQMKSPITSTSYTVASLQSATNSFSQEFIIGEGSLGRVYKADFPNGKVMAVKKIDNSALSLQEEDNFLEAVSNMSRLRHPNIVTLAGYCAEHGQRLLVYECIGNGNLHDMLHFAEDSSKALSWNARVRIALGTARALEYLHEVCLPSVVHRNFKSANILLDEELNPHLSDCGLAALTPNTERQVSSTQMVGSFGYSAPEFALSGVYTVKSDVYSFGVVMLELLTGRKPLDSSRVRSEQSLVRWATPQLHDIDALAKMVDPTLNGMYPAKSLSRFADIIALCVQPEPEFRPPMSEVVQALVRLVQRASVVKRRPSDESGYGHKTPDHEGIDICPAIKHRKGKE